MKLRTEPQTRLELKSTQYSFRLDGHLTLEELDNVALVLWHRYVDPETGRRKIEITCFSVEQGSVGILIKHHNSNRINHDKIARRAYRCHRLAYKVWFFRGPPSLPSNFHDRTSAIATTYFEIEACNKLVNAGGKTEIKICKHCNFTMACQTESDIRQWRRHTHTHISEKRASLFQAECNCPGVDLTNQNIKYNHYRLHHSGGKYKACDKCGHIDTVKALNNHDCTGHSLICPDCAKVFANPQSLAGHVRNQHMTVDCPDCCITIVGYRRYCRHRMKEHDQLRYECQQCDKKFISNNALKTHMMNVHIRSRPYNCRYGCNMAYNDVSNRNSHEKKVWAQYSIIRTSFNLLVINRIVSCIPETWELIHSRLPNLRG